MNTRQRFRETFAYGRPDRVPYFEDGLRDDVLATWRAQGHAPEAALGRLPAADRRERIAVDFEPRPRPKQWPDTRRSWRRFRPRLDPDDPGRLPTDWAKRVQEWHTRDHVLELPVQRGFFLSMGVHDWRRFEQVVYWLHDEPALIAEAMEMYGEFHTRLTERVLRDVRVDLAVFSEPVGGNDRPLLSPAMYEQFVLRSYRPVLDVLRAAGVETIIFLTYANARVLLPAVVAAGFNCLWACERGSRQMSYRSIRRQLGKDLRLIGGIDLDVLLGSKKRIEREIRTKVPPLLEEGGYIPLADGRVRAHIPFENYLFYRQVLADVISGH